MRPVDEVERIEPIPMDCTEFLTRYSDYDDSLVSSTEAARFRGHMDRCSSCARYDRVLRKGRMVARQLPQPEPSVDFVPRLRARLWRESHAARPSPRPRLPLALSGVTLAAATLALLVLLAPPRPDLLGTLAAAGGAGEGGATPRAVAAAPAPVLFPAVLPTPAPVIRPALPAVRLVLPREWNAVRVDPTATSSYSPLVTGPPAFRTSRARPPHSIPAYRRSTD